MNGWETHGTIYDWEAGERYNEPETCDQCFEFLENCKCCSVCGETEYECECE